MTGQRFNVGLFSRVVMSTCIYNMFDETMVFDGNNGFTDVVNSCLVIDLNDFH